MTWFRPDPAAKVIIACLESQPERWREKDRYLLLDSEDAYAASVKLWISAPYELLSVERPEINLDARSRRALWRAYERWAANGRQTVAQRNRAALLAALEGGSA